MQVRQGHVKAQGQVSDSRTFLERRRVTVGYLAVRSHPSGLVPELDHDLVLVGYQRRAQAFRIPGVDGEILRLFVPQCGEPDCASDRAISFVVIQEWLACGQPLDA